MNDGQAVDDQTLMVVRFKDTAVPFVPAERPLELAATR
jgi:hypothetical protein